MRLRNKIFLAVLTFLVVYVFSLILWIQVKPYYGYALTQVGARLAGWTTGLRVESVGVGKKAISVSFAGPVLTKKGLEEMVADFDFDVSRFTYNVPLTVALVAGLFPFFRWQKRYLFEIILILLFVHLLFIYLFCTQHVFYGFWKSGLRAHSSSVQQFFLEFMWTFTQNLVIPFEPFLVAVYLWLRGRESSGADGPTGKKAPVSGKKKGKRSKKRR